MAMSLLAVGAAAVGGAALAAEAAPKKAYVCPPCGCAADGKEFPEPGTCPECGMTLVEKAAEPPKPAPQEGGLLARRDERKRGASGQASLVS